MLSRVIGFLALSTHTCTLRAQGSRGSCTSLALVWSHSHFWWDLSKVSRWFTPSTHMKYILYLWKLSGALHRSLLSVLKCMWPCIDSCFYESSTCFLCKFRLQCVVRFVSILHDIIIVFYCCCAMFREWLSQFLTWAYHCNANVNLYLPIKLQPAYPSSDQNPVMESVCVFYFHCVLCSVPLYGMDLETFLGQIATYHPELSRSTKNRMGSTTEHGESRRHGCCLCLLKSLYG